MEKYLTQDEIIIAKNIINISLANAAEAFSKLAKDKVTLQQVEIPPTIPDTDLNHVINSLDKLYVLVTEVKGDLPAESYLVFTQENAALTASHVMGSHNSNEEMQEAMLLEVDNILTASVVTQFSNFFGKSIYGDVPHLIKLNKTETEEVLTQKMSQYDLRVTFKTCFVTNKLKIHPEFVWIFTQDLIQAVKSLAKDRQAIEELHKYERYLEQYVML
ncbi:MAG: chemotaxis protein CheC [Candidatus Cyclobacteriaceae bacterium M3_2C_046]